MRRQSIEATSQNQVLLTWALVLCWVGLMTFGVISIINPRWLQALSRPGIAVETRDYKSYGDDLLSRGKYRSAIAQYEYARKLQPENLGVAVNLAIACNKLGDTSRGVEILTETLAAAGEHARTGIIHYNLGELHEARGDVVGAIGHYRQAIGFDMRQDLVYRKLGLLHRAREDYPAARTAFEETLAAQLDVTLPYKHMLRRTMEEWKGDAETLRALEAQLARPLRPEEMSRYDFELVRDRQACDAEIAKTHNFLGAIAARLGDLSDAEAHFRHSLEIWPGNVDATRALDVVRSAARKSP